jgi:glycosyltransferase involved in cell wall biosynthesis
MQRQDRTDVRGGVLPVPAIAPGQSHVRILMGTWNGAAHLSAQLDSLLVQDHADWSLILRDDGSADSTLACLAAFREAHPDRSVTILPPGYPPPGSAPRGAAANFLRLLAHAATLPRALTAFADQDDVWLPHKLSRAIAVLGPDAAPGAPPAVYASRSIHTDRQLRPRGPSGLHPHPPAFTNALVQNVLGGNTIVMNPAATALVASTCPAALAGEGVPFHDWWVYLVASGAGARIMNDAEPGLLYRQHGANVLGAHAGLAGALGRLATVAGGGWRDWIDRNLAALNQVADLLAPDQRSVFEGFLALRRDPSPRGRLARLRRLGIHRQTRAGDLLIQGLALTGRL